MIRIMKETNYNSEMKYLEAAGLSTDTKPTANLVTGSRFTEVDTGDVYAFNEVNGTWNRIVAGPAAEPEPTETTETTNP